MKDQKQFKKDLMDYIATTVLSNFDYDINDIKEELKVKEIQRDYDADNGVITITLDNNIYIINIIEKGDK